MSSCVFHCGLLSVHKLQDGTRWSAYRAHTPLHPRVVIGEQWVQRSAWIFPHYAVTTGFPFTSRSLFTLIDYCIIYNHNFIIIIIIIIIIITVIINFFIARTTVQRTGT